MAVDFGEDFPGDVVLGIRRQVVEQEDREVKVQKDLPALELELPGPLEDVERSFHCVAGLANRTSRLRVTSPLTIERPPPADPTRFLRLPVHHGDVDVVRGPDWASLWPVGTLTLNFFASSRVSFSGQSIRAVYFATTFASDQVSTNSRCSASRRRAAIGSRRAPLIVPSRCAPGMGLFTPIPAPLGQLSSSHVSSRSR